MVHSNQICEKQQVMRDAGHVTRAARVGMALVIMVLFLATGRQTGANPSQADAVAKIYWANRGDASTGTIWRMDSNGDAVELMVNGLDNPRGLVLDEAGGRMYWLDRRTGNMGRANLDGTNENLSFCSGLPGPDDMVLDPGSGTLYWTDPVANQIVRSSKNSCNPQVVLDAGDGVSDPVGIALDLAAGKIYWTEFTSGRVKRANIDGTNIQTLVSSGLEGPLEIKLDIAAGYMYVVDSALDTPGTGGKIVRAPMSGGSLTQIGPNMDNPRGLALDLEAGHIYWADFGFRVLKRMSLSGSDVTTLRSGGTPVSDPRSIALLTGGSTAPCYSLLRRHTGQGSDPAATPDNSSGCPSGEYNAGVSITVSAIPDSGWGVSSWSGTNNNGSTATINTVTMPASDHTVVVNYGQQCYTLLRQHTGQGSDPVADPQNSPGCPSGQYKAGTSIAVSASAANGWAVGGWSGTTNNSSTATTNTVIMPPNNHTVIVHYGDEIDCFILVLQHTGEGNDPIASPPSSAGCDLGWYEAGALITLTADPAPEWRVKSWSGTTNNNSTANTNTVIMPGNPHTAIANYEPPPCYELSLYNQGQGTPPVASPPNSSGCGGGAYHVGEVITLTANPAVGWEVQNWSGTIDDANATNTNVAVMPAGPHTVIVRYRTSAAEHSYLPFALSIAELAPSCYSGDLEIESNDGLTEARKNGPFCLGREYRGRPTDESDIFLFDSGAGRVRVSVTDHRGPNVTLQVYDDNNVRLDYDSDASDGLEADFNLPVAQRFYVFLYVRSPNVHDTSFYTLKVTLE